MDASHGSLVSCPMCGGSRDRHQRSQGASVFCSTKCEELYAETHSYNLIAAGIISDEWSYRARCAASVALIGENPNGGGGDSSSSTEADADRFKNSVHSLETLKGRLQGLRKELPAEEGASAGTSAQMRDWIVRFDRLMRSLDVIFSDDFAAKLSEHVVEFDAIHNSTDAKTASMLEVKKLLADIARAVPMNRLIAEKRVLLQRVLDKQAPKVQDKLILTLDGGGMRAMVTLIMLIELLRVVRLKSGKPHAMLTDCFHMVVGTSTGGIVGALIVLLGMPLEEVLKMYLTMGARFFGASSRVSGTLDPMSMVVHYSDYAMLEFLLKLFGTRRLDDDATKFKSDSLRGANGTRFSVTALNISEDPAEFMLLRNYEPPADASLGGTNRCFVVGAVRSTSSAVSYIHPWGRHYAPLKTTMTSLGKETTAYATNSDGSYRTNLQIILDSAATKQERDRLAKLSAGDTVMNRAVNSDGGAFANNPTEVAIQEARELFAQEQQQVNLIVANFGTGLLPRTKNRTWSHVGINNPAERHFLGDHNIRNVLTDLINGGIVSPATDTERTARRVLQLYGQFASVTRVNPPLRTPFRLDDFSTESAQAMMADTTAYRDSPEGKALIEQLADKIVAYSDKLRALGAPAKPQ